MKTIITEKPSVAKEIANVLNVQNRKDGWIEGQGYAITWAFGHLIELCTPDVYGWGDWNLNNLPMLPNSFKMRPAIKWNSNTKSMEPDKGIQKQLSIIEDLFNVSDEIIVATDAGREGELIFRYIYKYLECRKPFKRLWVSSLTEKAIKQGFQNLQDGESFDNLYYSAKCRSEADWLIGMNATRALTIGAAFKSKFSLGRVQTPTLAILCQRFLENKEFVPEPFYNISITLEKNGKDFKAKSDRYQDKGTVEETLQKVKGTNTATIEDIEKKDKKENPPLLYDLTTLQRDANKKYSFSANETLKLAQSLYEKKHISYPRTSSCYISDDVFDTIPELLSIAGQHERYGGFARELAEKELNSQSVNSNKVTDHHALLITEQYPKDLGEKETKIYELILVRMIEAFSEACYKATTKVTINCAEIKFIAKGSIIKEGKEGWRIVRGTTNKDDKKADTEEDNQVFPDLSPYESLNKIAEEIISSMTKPKPLHTEASLLLAMETCGKDIEDEGMKEVMKESGIGTPATRANIIEVLLKRQYIERNKKKLIPTPKGITTYKLLKDKEIASPELTGKWEARLEKINKGVESADLFMNDIRDYTKEITADVIGIGKKINPSDLKTSNQESILCPKCKTGELRKGKKNHYCSNWKSGCDFVLWDTIASKKISERQVKELAQKGKSSLIKGFKSKKGKDFSAYLVLNEAHKVEFQFEKQF